MAAGGIISVVCMASNIPYAPHRPLSNPLLRHLGSFHVLPAVNCAAVNTGLHVSLDHFFFFFPENAWISMVLGLPYAQDIRSYGSSVFSVLRRLLLYSAGRTNLHFQRAVEVALLFTPLSSIYCWWLFDAAIMAGLTSS